MSETRLATLLFSSIVLTLVLLILAARRVLLPSGVATVACNEKRSVEGRLGEKLLDALGAAGIALPSACGGKGTCGQCRVRVEGRAACSPDGGGAAVCARAGTRRAAGLPAHAARRLCDPDPGRDLRCSDLGAAAFAPRAAWAR